MSKSLAENPSRIFQQHGEKFFAYTQQAEAVLLEFQRILAVDSITVISVWLASFANGSQNELAIKEINPTLVDDYDDPDSAEENIEYALEAQNIFLQEISNYYLLSKMLGRKFETFFPKLFPLAISANPKDDAIPYLPIELFPTTLRQERSIEKESSEESIKKEFLQFFYQLWQLHTLHPRFSIGDIKPENIGLRKTDAGATLPVYFDLTSIQKVPNHNEVPLAPAYFPDLVSADAADYEPRLVDLYAVTQIFVEGLIGDLIKMVLFFQLSFLSFPRLYESIWKVPQLRTFLVELYIHNIDETTEGDKKTRFYHRDEPAIIILHIVDYLVKKLDDKNYLVGQQNQLTALELAKDVADFFNIKINAHASPWEITFPS